MTHQVFEYFFDPEDLEPFYSELPTTVKPSRNRVVLAPEQGVDETTTWNRRSSADTAVSQRDHHLDGPATVEPTKEQAAPEAPAAEALPTTDEASELEAVVDESKAAQTGAVSAESSESTRTRIRRLLSVHALGQYVFCVRSAILSAERGDQRDIDERLPRLTYLPNFERERIEEMLSAKMTQLGFFVLYGVCLVILMKMGVADQNRWAFYPSLIALLGLSFWSLNIMVCILELAIRRRAAIRAEAREPEPNISGIERVNWWSMLKAGFEPINYERPFQHPELPLEGSPWRVLQRGSRRIPVIKSGSRKLGDRKGELYPKHQVRLVAYALLLESMGHTEVPYGLVFPVDSPRGLAYPITDELRERAVRLLYEFEHKLAESQHQNIQPQLPENRNRCANCDYGKPVPTDAREVELARKGGQQLVVLQHRSGDLFRCECADRFGSAPPHGLSVKIGLTAVVQ